MAALNPPVCAFDWPAPTFELGATDGRRYRLEDVAGPKGTLVMFICNHCPFVLAVLDRLISDVKELQSAGIGVAAICSNDPVAYPADGFDKMRELAELRGFPFPYLHDPDQTVAKTFGAVCTPDFFGFNAKGGLQYRGRLDAGRLDTPAAGTPRELLEAMLQVADSGQGPRTQTPSIGCSIKWSN